MSRITEHHKQLNVEGVGKCSVPMWQGGTPSGFCDAPAYGEPPASERVWHGPQQRYVRADNRYDGYVPALACPCHGGPASRVYKDGTAWCAVLPDFIDLQASAAGFGDTPGAARAHLKQQTSVRVD